MSTVQCQEYVYRNRKVKWVWLWSEFAGSIYCSFNEWYNVIQQKGERLKATSSRNKPRKYGFDLMFCLLTSSPRYGLDAFHLEEFPLFKRYALYWRRGRNYVRLQEGTKLNGPAEGKPIATARRSSMLGIWDVGRDNELLDHVPCKICWVYSRCGWRMYASAPAGSEDRAIYSTWKRSRRYFQTDGGPVDINRVG